MSMQPLPHAATASMEKHLKFPLGLSRMHAYADVILHRVSLYTSGNECNVILITDRLEPHFLYTTYV